MAIQAIGSSSSVDYAKMAQDMFKKVDANNDGSVDESEFKSALSQSGASDDQINNLFTQTDSDSDGQISESEMATAMKNAGPQGDGKAGKAGGPPPSGPPPGGAPPGGAAKGGKSSGASGSDDSDSDAFEIYDEKDSNKDGTVTFQEEVQYNIKHMNDKRKSGSADNQQNSQGYSQDGKTGLTEPKSTLSILT